MPRKDRWLIALATPISLLGWDTLNFAAPMAGAEALAPASTPASDGTRYGDPADPLCPLCSHHFNPPLPTRSKHDVPGLRLGGS